MSVTDFKPYRSRSCHCRAKPRTEKHCVICSCCFITRRANPQTRNDEEGMPTQVSRHIRTPTHMDRTNEQHNRPCKTRLKAACETRRVENSKNSESRNSNPDNSRSTTKVEAGNSVVVRNVYMNKRSSRNSGILITVVERAMG